MSQESAPQNHELIVPGMVIELDDLTQFDSVEDMIAYQVDPDLNPELWVARTSAKEQLRPKVKGREFNGRITDVTLTVMEDPYEKLATAKERGVKLGTGNMLRENDRGTDIISKYVGLEYTATLNSTGRGTLGSVRAELWYYPFAKELIRATGEVYTKKHILKTTGEMVEYPFVLKDRLVKRDESEAVRRVISKPVYDPLPLEQADTSARHIGFKVLQDAYMNPIKTPMRD